MLESLRQAVGNALEKKRCLGQYAVVWKDGQPVFLGGDSWGSAETREKMTDR